jgi:basic membrane protein A
MYKRQVQAFGVVAALCGLLATACGSSSKAASGTSTTAAPSSSSSSTTAQSTASTLPAYIGQGTTPAGEPDTNKDGKVVIGVLSPGDTHDHGYYESFVDAANTFAQQKGWKIITVDKTPAAGAVQAARNLCRQGVDMVAIGASEIANALTVATEPECNNVFFYINGGSGNQQTPNFTQSADKEGESAFASGVAAGLLMKEQNIKKAGFITGPQVAFTTGFYNPWVAGIKSVVSDATAVATYTGDLNDSGKAVEAFNAQKAQGVGLVYPYLGGSTFAVAALANQSNIPVLTPGTDNCSSASPKFAISVIFSPGDYFAAALKDYADGKLPLGVTRQWRMGVDPVPTVKICSPAGNDAQTLSQTIQDIGSGKIDVSKYANG